MKVFQVIEVVIEVRSDREEKEDMILWISAKEMERVEKFCFERGLEIKSIIDITELYKKGVLRKINGIDVFLF